MASPYESIVSRMRELTYVGAAAGLLGWDEETYLPKKGRAFRGDQKAFLSGWAHEQFTDPKVGGWLSECEGSELTEDQRINVREWRRDYDRATKLPKALVEELERTRSEAHIAWIEARQKSDFSIFKPGLEKLVALTRQTAEAWGYEEHLYNALLDAHEPGAKVSKIRPLLESLRAAVIPILSQAIERSKSIPEDFLAGDYPIEAQQAFNRKVAEAFGFDFEAGRIDTAVHPFCAGIAPGDCRMTTRYDARDFSSSLYGVLHETGHGLYTQGTKAEHFATPLGQEVSLGIHESQSRFWENHIGRSTTFWRHWYPVACEHFPHLRKFTPEQIAAAVNRVAPSFIRVEADPVTYDAHILLRVEVEIRIFSGELTVAEIPAYWNEQFEKLLGLKVPNDAQGCLQDVHWSWGGFGYFATYTLGNLNAAQLSEAMRKKIPSLDSQLEQGNYQQVLSWLRENIHQHGRRYLPDELMKRATGSETKIDAHVAMLRKQ